MKEERCTCGILKKDHFRENGSSKYRHFYIEKKTELERSKSLLESLETEKKRLLKRINELESENTRIELGS